MRAVTVRSDFSGNLIPLICVLGGEYIIIICTKDRFFYISGMKDLDSEKPARINAKYIIKEIKDEFLFEKGYLYTAYQILLKPSKTINGFLYQKRGAVTKPILFLIISVIIYSLSNSLLYNVFKKNYGYDASSYTDVIFFYWQITDDYGDKEAEYNVSPFLNENIEYVYIIFIIILTIVFRVLFLKNTKNIYEIAVSLFYIFSVQLLLLIPFHFISGLSSFFEFPTFTIGYVGLNAVLVSFYFIWAISNCFEGKRSINLLKSLFGYYLSGFIFLIIVFYISTFKILLDNFISYCIY